MWELLFVGFTMPMKLKENQTSEMRPKLKD